MEGQSISVRQPNSTYQCTSLAIHLSNIGVQLRKETTKCSHASAVGSQHTTMYTIYTCFTKSINHSVDMYMFETLFICTILCERKNTKYAYTRWS